MKLIKKFKRKYWYVFDETSSQHRERFLSVLDADNYIALHRSSKEPRVKYNACLEAIGKLLTAHHTAKE